MSLDDESITAQPEPKYEVQNNTQSFELIFLNSQSSRWYHQAFIVPPSSSTTPTKNLGLG
jgi:hypothetical protein